MTSSVEVCTRPLLYDQVTWQDVKILRELEVQNRQEYEALKGELIEHHDAPPNSLLFLRSPYEVEAFYISAHPTMYRTAIYLHDFYRDTNPTVWRRLLRPFSEDDLALYDMYMEDPRGRQQPLRDKAFEVFRKRVHAIHSALLWRWQKKYATLTQPFREHWAEQDWNKVHSTILREMENAARTDRDYMFALSVLLSIVQYVRTWSVVGRQIRRVQDIGWPSPQKIGWASSQELRKINAPILILPLWGLDDNNWLPLLGVLPDG